MSDNNITFKIGKNAWWSMDIALAVVIHAALVDFKGHERNGYPACLEKPEDQEWVVLDPSYPDVKTLSTKDGAMERITKEWEAIIQSMIDAFALLKEEDQDWQYDPKLESIVNDGLLNFATYYVHLWD